MSEPLRASPIAIVGMACRFPGAASPVELWQLLSEGRDSIGEVPAGRWKNDEFYDANPAAAGKISCRRGGFLDRVDEFDPQFFGISAREAAHMDPQQRLLLEVAWEALEDAGTLPETLRGSRTGVFVGISGADYPRVLFRDPNKIDAYMATGSAHSVAANRLSYYFDLKGPSFAIDTACSSSLVAVHVACQSLRQGESQLAIVGGVNLILSPETSISLSKSGGLSPDGVCRPFDADGNGMVRSEGCGVVILKSLENALADRNRIYAVIRGSAINNDGRTNGLTAPNRRAQEEVLRAAYRDAHLSFDRVGYVEAHGTGTPLGDLMEIQALAAVFGERSVNDPLRIGSIKSNIGHTEAAAGIAGLIKVALSLAHREIARSLHFNKPHPYLLNKPLPIQVAASAVLFPHHNRYAGVSSFGFGGTNAHVVLEEAPADALAETMIKAAEPWLLPLSAKSAEACRALAKKWQETPSVSPTFFDAQCASAARHRLHHPYRVAVVGSTLAQMKDRLSAFLSDTPSPGVAWNSDACKLRLNLVFVFSGHGTQWHGMGNSLLKEEPVFRRTLQMVDTIIQKESGWSVIEALQNSAIDFDDPAITQPMIFAIQLALVELWRSWGIVPSAVIGHSMGEVTAAYVAGILSLETAVMLIQKRGQALRSAIGKGKTAVVQLSIEEGVRLLTDYRDRLSIAAHNGPQTLTISGDAAALQEVLTRLDEQGVFYRLVQANGAAHSHYLDESRQDFETAIALLPSTAPTLPFFSTVDGKQLSANVFDAHYWGRNMREPVSFFSAVSAALSDGYTHFLEIGPHPALSPALQETLRHRGIDGHVLGSLRRNEPERATLLETLGSLYTLGAPIRWETLYPGIRKPVSLPTYPWQQERYWVEEAPHLPLRTAESTETYSAQRWSHMVASATRQSRFVPIGLSIEAIPAMQTALTRLCLAYIQRVWSILQLQDSSCTPLLDMDQHGILPKYHTLLERWRLLISQESDVAARNDVEAALHSAKAAAEPFPELFEFIRVFGDSLVELLTGKRDPLELYFPNGSFERMEALYEHARVSQYFNEVARAAIAAFLGACPRHRPLRVLEIGAGTGATTSSLVSLFSSHLVDYTYTDVSPFFLEWGKKKFHQYPFMTYRTLDIDRDLQAQGYELGTYDLVIAANVLHATRRMDDTMARVRSLLTPDGVLVAIEATEDPTWSAITLGFIDGYSLYEDTELRPDSPLLSTSLWQDVLRRQGFDEVVIVPGENAPATCLGQHVIMAKASSLQSQAKENDDIFYKLIWESTQPPSSVPLASASGTWIIVSDTDGLGHQLAERLNQEGCSTIEINEPETLQSVVADLHQNRQPIAGLIFLSGLDENNTLLETSDGAAASIEQTCGTFLSVLRQTANRIPALYVVVRGAQAVRTPESVLSPFGSLLWGLAQQIPLEMPPFFSRCIDLDPQALRGDHIDCIMRELTYQDRDSRVAYRDHRRFLPKLVSQAVHEDTCDTPQMDQAASYLVTGGLGKLGLQVAQWLVARGARHIVLIGRSALPERESWESLLETDVHYAVVSMIQEMETATGARVYPISADVSDDDAMSRLFNQFGHTLPPLKGIVHAAGVASVTPLNMLTLGTLKTDWAAKVGGTIALHRLTQDLPLDFMIFFSSISALWGTKGLSTYTSANLFMDMMAQYRRAHGLPSTTINWGAWESAGMSATAAEIEQQRRSGFVSLSKPQCFQALDRSLTQDDQAQWIVAKMNWSIFKPLYETARASSLLDRIVIHSPSHSPNSAPVPPVLKKTFEGLLSSERPSAILDYLKTEVGRALKCSPERLDCHAPLNAMGLDSLVAIELKHALATKAGIELPIAQLLSGSSLVQVAASIADQMGAGREEGGQSAPENALQLPFIASLENSDAVATRQYGSWITSYAYRPDAVLRLFCFPYAGGGPGIFRGWDRFLPNEVEICPILLPGRDRRLNESAFHQLGPLVKAIADGILPYLDKPFAFFGHCMGALVAFELARYLRRHTDRRPVHFFPSASAAPHHYFLDVFDPAHPAVHNLPDAQLLEFLNYLNGTPQAVLANPELMQTLLPTLRADFTIAETYHYQDEDPLGCPMTAFGGIDDPRVSVTDVDAWQAQTTAAFSRTLFSGGHYFINTDPKPLLEVVAKELAQLILRCRK